MYFISSWICTNSSKNLFVKIISPGGRVEIHDRPIQASEVLSRNPKCCVAQPTVFHQPYAVVSPTTTLALGQKYYVLPIGTIRELQLKYSASQSQQANIQLSNDHKQKSGKKDDDHNKMESSSSWWLMINNKNGQKVKNGEKLCLKKKGLWINVKAISSEKKTVSRRERGNENSEGAGNGGMRLSLKHFDHWQPGLESIIEE